jgi:hypothetical protein
MITDGGMMTTRINFRVVIQMILIQMIAILMSTRMRYLLAADVQVRFLPLALHATGVLPPPHTTPLLAARCVHSASGVSGPPYWVDARWASFSLCWWPRW